MYTNDCSEPEYDDGVDDHNYVVTGCERDDYDPQLDEMRLREEIDYFLDHLKPEQFGAALLWMSTFDDPKEAVLNRWVGALFLGVQPLPHEIAQVRDWMTDCLSKRTSMYKELLDLYS